MKIAALKLKRTIKAKVTATQKEVKIKFPKQSLGVITISYVTPNGTLKFLRNIELWVTDGGDKIKAEVVS